MLFWAYAIGVALIVGRMAHMGQIANHQPSQEKQPETMSKLSNNKPNMSSDSSDVEYFDELTDAADKKQ